MALSSCVLGNLRNTRRFIPTAAEAAAFHIVNHSIASISSRKLVDIDDIQERNFRNNIGPFGPANRICGGYTPRILHERLMDIRKIRDVASFAVKEFNCRKNAQLQLVRAVKGFHKKSYFTHYFVTLEAVDHVAEEPTTYQAVVRHDQDYPEKLELSLFGLAAENCHGSFWILYYNRRNQSTESTDFITFGVHRSDLIDDRGVHTQVGGVKMEIPVKKTDEKDAGQVGLNLLLR